MSLGPAPEHLQDAGREAWASAAQAPHIKPEHRLQVLRLAEAYDCRAALALIIATDGLVAPGSKGQPRPHPALVILNTTEQAIRSDERALGLAPDTADVEEAPNALGDFLARQRDKGAKGGTTGSEAKHIQKAR